MTGPLLEVPGTINHPTTPKRLHTLATDTGYNANVFPGKQEQMIQVVQHLENCGFLPKELVKNEVDWFYM